MGVEQTQGKDFNLAPGSPRSFAGQKLRLQTSRDNRSHVQEDLRPHRFQDRESEDFALTRA
jgi:hypothetical protein